MERDRKMVAIVIPVYKEIISDLEEISLRQCVKVLRDYDLILIKPHKLDVGNYLRLIKNPIIVNMDPEYFTSISGYNKLLISPRFYEKLRQYKFILIHQLDAFVFKNNLISWCNLNVDYIGAPWFDHAPVQRFRESLLMSGNPVIRWIKKKIDFGKRNPPWVGNGGLSLRRVSKFCRLSYVLSPVISRLGYREWNEDLVWSLFVPKYFPFFQVAASEVAQKFSMETGPLRDMLKRDNEVPFGTHGWYASKEKLDFWKPFIEKEGYKTPEQPI